MSKDWTKEQLETASQYMKEHGQMSYEEVCEILADEETKRQYYWNYLEKLRRSGVTNMFGAAPYLMEEFGLSKPEANKILGDWMKNYNLDDYKDLK